MQDIIVVVIGIIVFGLMGWKTYNLISRKPNTTDKCGGCTGCALKEDLSCETNLKSKKRK